MIMHHAGGGRSDKLIIMHKTLYSQVGQEKLVRYSELFLTPPPPPPTMWIDVNYNKVPEQIDAQGVHCYVVQILTLVIKCMGNAWVIEHIYLVTEISA